MNHDLELLAKHFQYRSDGKLDNWHIMPMDNLRGDCDDYAVTALYLMCKGSLLKFWLKIITFQAVFWFTKSPTGGGHLVLWMRDHGYIDNWDRKWVTKDYMKQEGYKFVFPWLAPFVALKMFNGVILRLFNKK